MDEETLDKTELEAPDRLAPGAEEEELAPDGEDAGLAPDGEDDALAPDGEAEDGEPQLAPEVAARRAAALAHVRMFGDPVLRTKARPIAQIDDALHNEIARMGMLMNDALGVGLAATQVGALHRLLVYRVQQQAPVIALINPEIEWSGREQETMEEGCLSLPSVLVDVERPIHIRVRAVGEEGEELLIEASGLEARVIQHEIDHLDGVLILDRTTRDQRKEAMRKLREAEQAA
jgi:peptide deformylase